MIRFLMLTLSTIALIAMMSVSDVSAQGRGRGHGNGNGKWGNKCEKFVNCHDARDGRWDDRGPRRRLGLRSRYSRYENIRIYRGRRNRRVFADRVYVRNRRRY